MSSVVNFRTCCRLCLAENCVLSNIFVSNEDTSTLAHTIFSFNGITIHVRDRISTSLCNDCLAYLHKYEQFKNATLINQVKLHELLSRYDAEEQSLLKEIIPIKDEDESDDECIIVPCDDLSIDQYDMNDEPPILSPNLSPWDMLCHLDNRDAITIDDNRHVMPIIETIETILEESMILDETEHGECLKTPPSDDIESILPDISAPTSDISPLDSAISDIPPPGVEISDAIPLGTAVPETNNAATISQNDSLDKIEFAAGLELAQKMDSINMEPFTHTEIQYERRMKLIYSQIVQSRCACHNTTYPNIGQLGGHVRKNKSGVFLPSKTCPTCCTTFLASTNYRRHLAMERPCGPSGYTRMRDVANTLERSIGKHRNYQTFRCTLCGSATRLLDTYIAHVDEHVQNITGKLKCHCGKHFESNIAAYRQHLLGSCVMKLCCDMCDVDFTTAERFREHCAVVHDNDEGEQFLVNTNFTEMELPFTPLHECPECYLKCTQVAFLMQHVCLAHGYSQESAKRIGGDSVVVPLENTTNEVSDGSPGTIFGEAPIPKTINDINLTQLREEKLFYQVGLKNVGENAFECQICKIILVYRGNFRRHLKNIHLYMTMEGCYSCSMCDKTFQVIPVLQRHYLLDHFSQCIECGHKSESLVELERHSLSHSVPQTYKPVMDNRLLQIGGGPPVLISIEDPVELKSLKHCCKLCKRLFATPRGLQHHIRRTHPYADFGRDDLIPKQFPRKCRSRACKEQVKSASDWMRHMRMHAEAAMRDDSSKPSDSKPDFFTCEKCSKIFTTANNLRYHLLSHQDGDSGTYKSASKYYCRICKLIFDTRVIYMQHEKTHLEELEKAVKNENRLQKSEGNDMGKNTYQCGECTKISTTETALKLHMVWHQRHTIDQPKLPPNDDKLNVMPPASERKNSIILFCKHCDDQFDDEAVLQVHMFEVHPRNIYVPYGCTTCPVCDREMPTTVGLSNHIRKHERLGEFVGGNSLNDTTRTNSRPMKKRMASARVRSKSTM